MDRPIQYVRACLPPLPDSPSLVDSSARIPPLALKHQGGLNDPACKKNKILWRSRRIWRDGKRHKMPGTLEKRKTNQTVLLKKNTAKCGNRAHTHTQLSWNSFPRLLSQPHLTLHTASWRVELCLHFFFFYFIKREQNGQWWFNKRTLIDFELLRIFKFLLGFWGFSFQNYCTLGVKETIPTSHIYGLGITNLSKGCFIPQLQYYLVIHILDMT